MLLIHDFSICCEIFLHGTAVECSQSANDDTICTTSSLQCTEKRMARCLVIIVPYCFAALSGCAANTPVSLSLYPSIVLIMECSTIKLRDKGKGVR